MESKWKGNDQELIQSHTTSYPQYQKRKKDTQKIWQTPTKDTHNKLNEQLFPKQVNIQLP